MSNQNAKNARRKKNKFIKEREKHMNMMETVSNIVANNPTDPVILEKYAEILKYCANIIRIDKELNPREPYYLDIPYMK
jgi:hypothetical protein